MATKLVVEHLMSDYFSLVVGQPKPSPVRSQPADRTPLRVGLVQDRWHPDPCEHKASLASGIQLAADHGAQLVCLQELTLSPYFAASDEPALERAEDLRAGPTAEFAREAARANGVHVQASLYERGATDRNGGFNTAILVSPAGDIVARTRKLHLPVTAGYFEDRHFEPGPADEPFPVTEIHGARLGLPTCWDQWFPEVARAYSLAGTDVIIYPTAIGSEPEFPDFDTQPLWERVIVGNGIANGTFMVAINRIGTEPPLTFYGSSFVSDPYGRILAKAPRDKPAVLVADLDLDQRRDWLKAFPFLETRRPDVYGILTVEDSGSPETKKSG